MHLLSSSLAVSSTRMLCWLCCLLGGMLRLSTGVYGGGPREHAIALLLLSTFASFRYIPEFARFDSLYRVLIGVLYLIRIYQYAAVASLPWPMKLGRCLRTIWPRLENWVQVAETAHLSRHCQLRINHKSKSSIKKSTVRLGKPRQEKKGMPSRAIPPRH
jgi:hypothetical protein